MPGEHAFRVEGAVVEVLPNRTYWVELANGHRLRAFVPGRVRAAVGPLAVGEKVRLQLSPYDLSVGRVLAKSGTI